MQIELCREGAQWIMRELGWHAEYYRTLCGSTKASDATRKKYDLVRSVLREIERVKEGGFYADMSALSWRA